MFILVISFAFIVSYQGVHREFYISVYVSDFVNYLYNLNSAISASTVF